MVRLRGIEPPHTVPETIALSTELQAQNYYSIITQINELCKVLYYEDKYAKIREVQVAFIEPDKK